MSAAAFAQRQQQYCAQILRFRKALNLTSISTMEALESRFIAPSVALQRWIPQGAHLLDVGSGMGVPGIPLLLARPDLRGTLVDRRMKRTEFLRHVVRSMGIDCKVFCCDMQVLALDPLADVLVARAVANAPELLAIAGHLVRSGGEALLPTSQAAALVSVDGWCAEDVLQLQFAGDLQQQVLRYRRL